MVFPAGDGGVGIVIFEVGFEHEGESGCTRGISRECVKPTHHPDAEGEGLVNPGFGVIVFSRCWLTKRRMGLW